MDKFLQPNKCCSKEQTEQKFNELANTPHAFKLMFMKHSISRFINDEICKECFISSMYIILVCLDSEKKLTYKSYIAELETKKAKELEETVEICINAVNSVNNKK